MKTTELKAQVRESVGKKQNKSLRNSGRVPGVVYSSNNAVHIDVDYKELKPVLFNHIPELILLRFLCRYIYYCFPLYLFLNKIVRKTMF